jgi:hypothetical protein
MDKKTKLSLNQETLRNLTQNELKNVAGGAGSVVTACLCNTLRTCLTCTCEIPENE